jgi:hypothetical protein
LVLFGCAGCKKIVKINVDQSLAPLTANTSPGKTVEWVATASGENFSVFWQPGLCEKDTPNPIPASYGKPAVCTVASQSFQNEDKSITYTYTLEGNVDGKPFRSPEYKMRVGPGGCPHC